MPKLIDLSTTERPVPNVAGRVGGMDVRSASSSGQGGQQLGAAIEHVGLDIAKQARVEEQRLNTLRAEDSFNQLQNRAMDLAFGDSGYTKVLGADAVSKPIRTDYTKRFDDAVSEISGTLTNDEQRVEFQKRVDLGRLKFQEGILHHLAKQSEVYGKQVFDGTITTAKRDAVASWDNPRSIDASLVRVDNAIGEYAQSQGWAQEFVDAQRRIKHGEIHSEVIGQAIKSGNWRYAQAWYDAHKEDIDVTTAKSLEAAVAQGTQKERAATYRADYLANENSMPVLENLRGRILADKELDDDRRNVLVGMVQNRQAVLENRARVDYDRKIRTLERGINELNSNTLAGYEPTPEQFAPYITAAKGTELEPTVRSAIALADSTRQFRNAPRTAQERLLTEGEAAIRQDPTKFDRKVLGAWRTIYDAQGRAIQDSPVSYAVQQGLVRPVAPLDLSKPAEAADALAERFSIARGMRQAYQAPFKPLTPAEVQLTTSQLAQAGTEQKLTFFRSLRQAAGNDAEGYMGIMQQIAPDSPATAIAGSHAGADRMQAADLILRGESYLRPNRKTDGSPLGGKLVALPPDGEFEREFARRTGDAFSGNAPQRDAHFQAVRSAYAALAVDKGGETQLKTVDSDLYGQAFKAVLGETLEHNGKTIVLPYGQRSSDFKDQLERRVTGLVDRGVITQDEASKISGLPLRNIGDGRYVVVAGDAKVVGKDGKDVVLDFNAPLPFRTSGTSVAPAPGPAPDPYVMALRATVPGQMLGGGK
jgi:hypothetical protein